MSAQTVVKQNKLETTLDKNQESNIVFISELDLSKMSITETGTIILPFMKKNKVMFVSGMDMSYIKERITYTKKKKFQTTIEVKDIITKTYMITKIEGIETVEEYTERNRELLIAESRKNIQKYPIQVVNQEISNLSTSESSWLPLQIQDKLKSNLQSYLGMKTVVDSKAESALKKLQAESENVGRDENTAIELGKIISAKFALFTKIRKVGANYVIAVDFTDLTTGEQLASCMSKEYSKAEYLYGNTGAVDELTLALSEKLGIKVSDLNKNYLTSGSSSFSVDEQLALAKENEAKFNQMMANYDAELAKLTTSNDINAIQNKKRIEAEKALLQEKQNAEKNRQAELQAQKERAEADKKLESERSIALKTQRDKLAQDAAAKAAEVRKLKMEKQGVLGQINVIESKKKALVEIRQGVENRSIELYNQLQTDIKSEFERITNKSYRTVELGSDGKPTEQALTRRENQRIAKYDELHKNFYADCESVKQATMSQQNALLQEINQDQTNLAKIKTVNSMGDELKVSFGPYEGSKNGWNAYLSLYSDGILVYTDTVIVSYEAVAGKKAPNMATELNDSVIEEYTNNVDMYSSLLTRGDPILYFVLEYSVNAKSEDNPSEYDFTYKNLKVYNTLSDVIVQNIAINKTEAKVMNPKQDLRIYDGILEKEKNAILLLWHGRIFMMPFIWNLKFPVNVLVSPHNDGRIIANIFHQMGVETVDGSSNENAFKAALNILKTLKKGKSIALVPDGPRGPRMRMTESPIYFAAKTGKPIIMATYSMDTAKVIKKSWDKFMIPKPFSKGIFIISEPFYVKKDISQEETNQLKLTLEQTLNTLTANADTLMGRVAVQPSDKPKKQRKHVHKNI